MPDQPTQKIEALTTKDYASTAESSLSIDFECISIDRIENKLYLKNSLFGTKYLIYRPVLFATINKFIVYNNLFSIAGVTLTIRYCPNEKPWVTYALKLE